MHSKFLIKISNTIEDSESNIYNTKVPRTNDPIDNKLNKHENTWLLIQIKA